MTDQDTVQHIADTTVQHPTVPTSFTYDGIVYQTEELYEDAEGDVWAFTRSLPCGMAQMAVYETLRDDPDRAIHYRLPYVLDKWGPLTLQGHGGRKSDTRCPECGYRHDIPEGTVTRGGA